MLNILAGVSSMETARQMVVYGLHILVRRAY